MFDARDFVHTGIDCSVASITKAVTKQVEFSNIINNFSVSNKVSGGKATFPGVCFLVKNGLHGRK